jgi:hypothetical protein
MIISVDLTKQIVEEGSNSISRKLLAFTSYDNVKEPIHLEDSRFNNDDNKIQNNIILKQAQNNLFILFSSVVYNITFRIQNPLFFLIYGILWL